MSPKRPQIPAFPDFNFQSDNQGFRTGPAGTVRDFQSLPNLLTTDRISQNQGDPSPIVFRAPSTGPGTGGAISPVPGAVAAISPASQDSTRELGAYGTGARFRYSQSHHTLV